MGQCQGATLSKIQNLTSPSPRHEGEATYVAYRLGTLNQRPQDPTCPDKRSRKQTELSPFHSDVFLLGGQKPETAEFLGALQTSPIPNFPKYFIPKLCPNKKSLKKHKC